MTDYRTLPKTVAYNAREGLQFEHRYKCGKLDDPWGRQDNVYGVPVEYLEWCQDNCPDRFGWHFESEPIYERWVEREYVPPVDFVHIGYITFEHQEDLVIFKLRHLKG
jgi:hypothetical protein